MQAKAWTSEEVKKLGKEPLEYYNEEEGLNFALYAGTKAKPFIAYDDGTDAVVLQNIHYIKDVNNDLGTNNTYLSAQGGLKWKTFPTLYLHVIRMTGTFVSNNITYYYIVVFNMINNEDYSPTEFSFAEYFRTDVGASISVPASGACYNSDESYAITRLIYTGNNTFGLTFANSGQYPGILGATVTPSIEKYPPLKLI